MKQAASGPTQLYHLLQNQIQSQDRNGKNIINSHRVFQIQAVVTTSGLLLSPPSPFFFNALIRAFSLSPLPHLSLSLFSLALRSRLLPDPHTFPSLFRASLSCSPSSPPPPSPLSLSLHSIALKLGLDAHSFVSNSLIHLYSSSRLPRLAHRLFLLSPHPDTVSWNSLISAYANSSDMSSALSLFDQMPRPNVVSWTALISGYVRSSLPHLALLAFRRMLASHPHTIPNPNTLVSVLSACSLLGALHQGKWVHAYLRANRIPLTVYLGTALVDMYSKCGDLILAIEVFEEMKERNLLAWTTAIKGLAMHGQGLQALSFFAQMLSAGITPDDIAFIGVLCACTHAGLVDEGRRIFNSMRKVYGIAPKVEHYGCLVDLLARAGLLEEARGLVEGMPMAPDGRVWGALMAGCRFHRDVGLAEHAVKHLIQLEPENGAIYVLLANIYIVCGRHQDAHQVRELMRMKKLMKKPGCSSIEIRGTIHQFLVGDTSHPQMQAILAKWEEIERSMKSEGYVSNRMDVMLDIEEEEKEEALARHSEKLAIAFGLISMREGAVIRIVKNLRVCGDCHHVTKFISKAYNREIIVRDRTRFHLFMDGICTCKDYW